jgi:ATP-dependent Lon protease
MRSGERNIWVWAEALELLQAPERMQRRIFAVEAAHALPCWQPAVDLFQDGDELTLLVALPGVDPGRVEVVLDAADVLVRGERAMPSAGHRAAIHRPVGIVLQTEPQAESPGPADMASVGTIAAILRYVSTGEGTHHLICQGQQRFRVLEFLDGHPFTVARVAPIAAAPQVADSDIEARLLQLRARAIEVLKLLPQAPQEILDAVQGIESAEALTDMVAGYLDVKPAEKQELLAQQDLRQRMDRLLQLMAHRIEVMRLSQQIDQRTKASMGQREREYLLREQMKSIQKELGEDESGHAAEIGELRKAIDAAGMPQEALKSMLRTYLDWLAELPWRARARPHRCRAGARCSTPITSASTRSSSASSSSSRCASSSPRAGPILCFVGPPGVGKTSLGQSIARALGRSSCACRSAACTTRPRSAAIAAPTSARCRATSSRRCARPVARPVMMLDEIDKLGVGGMHGDPSAALLEVLDPEQNTYLPRQLPRVPFDLSQVLFIATANMLDSIPGPLRDRMEIIAAAGLHRGGEARDRARYLVARQIGSQRPEPRRSPSATPR